MRFARPEDGAFNPRNTDEFFFVTTGAAAGANALGRLYSLLTRPREPRLKKEPSKVVDNADTGRRRRHRHQPRQHRCELATT